MYSPPHNNSGTEVAPCVFILCLCFGKYFNTKSCHLKGTISKYITDLGNTGELGYDGPLYDGFFHMTDDMLGPSPMHIRYSSYVYDGFCI